MTQTLNSTLDVERPPIPRSRFSQPFWDATREKKLLIQYCPTSGTYQFYPRPLSVATGRREVEWREVSGRGSIYAYTITRQAIAPFKGREPFAVAMVELEEGVRIMANIVDCREDQIAIGLKVVPHWAPLPSGEHLLMFRPA